MCFVENKNKGETFAVFKYMNDQENGSDTGLFICSKAKTRMLTNTGGGGADSALEAAHEDYPEAVTSAEGRWRGSLQHLSHPVVQA